MKLRLNHFALGARNIHEEAAHLRKETGMDLSGYPDVVVRQPPTAACITGDSKHDA